MPETFPMSAVLNVTEGFTAGSIKMAIDNVLTERRVKRLIERPLTFNELIGPLSNTHCVFSQDYEKIRQVF